jgi:hypothetical protein
MVLPIRQDSRFFAELPPEIRMAIYEAALVDTEDPFSLLQSCQQVHDEALPLLYKRSAKFTSHTNFIKWTERSIKLNLEKITQLRLTLSDIDLTLFNEYRTFLRPKHSVGIWKICNMDLKQLQQSFKKLPNLSSLTIIPPEHRSSAFRAGVYIPLLKSLPEICPCLRHLELHDDEELLDRIPALERVPNVTFTKALPRSSQIDPEDGERRRMPEQHATVELAALVAIVHSGRRASSAPAKFRADRAEQRSISGGSVDSGVGWS